jgi:hypothetical protein
MTDLSYDAPLRLLGEAKSERFPVDTAYAVSIYKGQPMILDLSSDPENAMPFVTARVVAATDVCLGIAAEGKVIASGDPENDRNFIEVYVAPTIVGFKSTVYTNADLGKTVYMSDSATLSETAGDNPQIGILRKVEDGFAYVELTTPQICGGA